MPNLKLVTTPGGGLSLDAVPRTRRIDTRAPLRGGGDLSQDREISIDSDAFGDAYLARAQTWTGQQVFIGGAYGAAPASGATRFVMSGELTVGGGGGAIDRNTYQVEHTGTTAEQPLYAYTFAPGAFNPNKLARLTVMGSVRNATGDIVSFGLRVTLGSRVVYSGGAQFIQHATRDRGWRLQSEVQEIGGAWQVATTQFVLGQPATVSGEVSAAPPVVSFAAHTSLNADPSAALQLAVYGQLSDGGAVMRKHAATLELL